MPAAQSDPREMFVVLNGLEIVQRVGALTLQVPAAEAGAAAPVAPELPPAEAEKMVWAFEQALSAARIDAELLRYLLAAVASLLAKADDSSPRTVFETFFRRSVSDDEWRDRYAHLFA